MQDRRVDDHKILDSISEIKTDIAKVVTLVEERNTSAILFRAEVREDFKEIKGYCAVRQESKLRMWLAIVGIIVMGIFSLGAAHNQINEHTKKIDKLEQKNE